LAHDASSSAPSELIERAMTPLPLLKIVAY